MGERWTENEIRRLAFLVKAGCKPDQIAEELGRSMSTVASRISRTNIQRVADISSSVSASIPSSKAQVRKMRKCRWCLLPFESSGSGEWTCPPCKETTGYRQMASS